MDCRNARSLIAESDVPSGTGDRDGEASDHIEKGQQHENDTGRVPGGRHNDKLDQKHEKNEEGEHVLKDRAYRGPGRFEEFEVEKDNSADHEQVADRREPLGSRGQGQGKEGIGIRTQSERAAENDDIEDDQNDREEGDLKDKSHGVSGGDEIGDVITHNIGKRFWFRHAQFQRAGSIRCGGPGVNNSLYDGVKIIHDETRENTGLSRDLLHHPQSLRHADAVAWETECPVIAEEGGVGLVECDERVDDVVIAQYRVKLIAMNRQVTGLPVERLPEHAARPA